jgi:hypothetical protein
MLTSYNLSYIYLHNFFYSIISNSKVEREYLFSTIFISFIVNINNNLVESQSR